LTPRYIIKTALDMAQQSAQVLSRLDPYADGKIAWDEFKNKVQAFSLFQFVDSALDLSPRGDRSLLELVDRAAKLGDYSSVWAIEGLGNYYANLQLRRGAFPDHLLSGNQSGMPSARLMPLHTGMGLALAESVLGAMSEESPYETGLLSQFLLLCRSNSQEGYWGAVFEALGLVARNLYPHLVSSIDLYLRQNNEELLAYFWHGIGRGIYFAPTNFLPFRSAPWKAVDMCLHEPPHELGKRNAVAGLAWALSLVNIRQPEILAAFLKCHEPNMGEADAVANGICSAMMIWLDSAPNDRYLTAMARYEPDSSLPPVWKKYVRQSCTLASHYYSVLKSQKRLGELFRYQHLSELTGTTNGAWRESP
jgi:hypothetical protein